jgi:hypothetical protein
MDPAEHFDINSFASLEDLAAYYRPEMGALFRFYCHPINTGIVERDILSQMPEGMMTVTYTHKLPVRHGVLVCVPSGDVTVFNRELPPVQKAQPSMN